MSQKDEEKLIKIFTVSSKHLSAGEWRRLYPEIEHVPTDVFIRWLALELYEKQPDAFSEFDRREVSNRRLSYGGGGEYISSYLSFKGNPDIAVKGLCRVFEHTKSGDAALSIPIMLSEGAHADKDFEIILNVSGSFAEFFHSCGLSPSVLMPEMYS